MAKTAAFHVVVTVALVRNVTCLQDNVMEGVKKDGQETCVIKVIVSVCSVLLKFKIYRRSEHFS